MSKLDLNNFTANVKTTKWMIKHGWKQSVKHKDPKKMGKPVMLIGQSGVGKTSIVNQMCEEMQEWLLENGHIEEGEVVESRVNNLMAKDSTDYSGMPLNINKKDEDGNDFWKMIFTHPQDIPTEGYGIMLLDEANRVTDIDMRSALLSLLCDREINGHKLGDGWQIVLAGNPFGSNYETQEFGPALKDRIVFIDYKPDMEDVQNYFKQRYPDHVLTKVLLDKPEIIDLDNKVENGSGDTVTPRTLEATVNITYDFGKDFDAYKQNKKEFHLLAGAYLGQGCNGIVNDFLTNVKHYKLEDLLQDPKAVENIERSNTPSFHQLNEEIVAYLIEKYQQEGDASNITKKESATFVKYFNYVPDEIFQAFCNHSLESASNGMQMVLRYCRYDEVKIIDPKRKEDLKRIMQEAQELGSEKGN